MLQAGNMDNCWIKNKESEAQLKDERRKKKQRKAVLSMHHCMTAQHSQLPLRPNK